MEARAPAGERVLGAEERLEHARTVAWRALNRRDRTEAELARTMVGKRVDPASMGQVLGELRDGGYVDDARYAERFADDRRRLDGWGSERIERRLLELGVAREHVAAALAGQDGEAEIDAAVALLRRRFPAAEGAAQGMGARERDRALGVLVRKGYGLDLAYDALRRFAGADDPL